VDRKREVEHEFRTSDKKKNEHNTSSMISKSLRWFCRCQTYQVRLFSTHTSPRVQPTVVSPRRLRQLKSKSALISFPATRAVNIMRMVAHA